MRWWNWQPLGNVGLVFLGILLAGFDSAPKIRTAHSQTLFPSTAPTPRVIYRLQGGSPPTPSPEAEPVVEQPSSAEAPWRVVGSDEVVDPVDPLDTELAEGPVFNLDLLQQFGTSPGGSGSGSRQGEVIGPGTGQSGVRGSSPGSGFGPGQGSGGGTGLEAGAQQWGPQTTGLIVDARGLDFLPSQSMRLFDPDGNQVYTPLNLSQDLNAAFVGSEGTAAYATSEEQARSLVNRIGERPHHIRAIRTLGYDLVITAEDAFSLRQMNEVDGFLNNFAVVVIWDANQASLP
ncbi:hypothetical protein L1047_14040 [Synechococcus sp. Nb3U1]|uniref:hypothetical protein n=1 Tax=Synechococcus sp. Nb3U1 TaxID=1914529 RepID=UPI001F2054C9|nr:hypothetical protein [Synechococcus sp. Nb3U1]MCF2972317.1 hypothetical protein [Synechococcus sp. Nb3U1]